MTGGGMLSLTADSPGFLARPRSTAGTIQIASNNALRDAPSRANAAGGVTFAEKATNVDFASPGRNSAGRIALQTPSGVSVGLSVAAAARYFVFAGTLTATVRSPRSAAC